METFFSAFSTTGVFRGAFGFLTVLAPLSAVAAVSGSTVCDAIAAVAPAGGAASADVLFSGGVTASTLTAARDWGWLRLAGRHGRRGRCRPFA
ncbi:MAG: hypothetical protein MZV70_51640 [Desulfobacterales bacterium]|nr:hypothetical protein [Desulfobacterales bacterium]